jgi:hypothetical protein
MPWASDAINPACGAERELFETAEGVRFQDFDDDGVGFPDGLAYYLFGQTAWRAPTSGRAAMHTR